MRDTKLSIWKNETCARQGDSSSDDDGDDHDFILLRQMEGFFTDSEAYIHLKDNLRKFVHPSPPLEGPKVEALQGTDIESHPTSLAVFDHVQSQSIIDQSISDGNPMTVSWSNNNIAYTTDESKAVPWYMQAW